MRVLIVGLALLVAPVFAFAQRCASDDLSPECDRLRFEAQMDRADHELNVVYQRLLAKMSKPKDEYVDYPVLKAKFIAAQRQWVRFRDAECDAWYLINEAGAERNLDRYSCMVDRTHDRTNELQAWQADLP